MEALEQLVPVVGDVLVDRYVLGRELGRGGFGVVFQATQKGLDEEVAIKLLLPHVLANVKLYQRFEREILIAKGLRHPNSVRILDVAKTDRGLPFYVMELVEGNALDDILAREGRLSEARTQKIGIQILKSLTEAHSKGVVHRDLKPGNVMLCNLIGEQDFVKVLDFGIAKALGEGGEGQQTETGLILGTPAYMSPEQAVSLRDIDGRSDLYTVGLILARCILGIQIVQGESPFVMLAQHGSRAPLPFPQEITASPLWPIIECATRKEREFRFPDAATMRSHLENLAKLPSTDVMLGKILTPLPGPTTPIAWTPEPTRGSNSGLIDSGAGFISDAINPPIPPVYEQAPPAGSSRALTVALVVVFLVLVLVFGVFLLMLNSGDDNGNHDDTTAVITPGSTEPTDDDSTSVLDEIGAPEVEELVVGNIDVAANAAANTSMAIAADRIRSAVPATHAIRFDGTTGVRVLLGEELLGVTPFEGLFPQVGRALTLAFERDGYRSTSREVMLSEAVVDVQLRRRRTERVEPDPPDDTPSDTPDENPSDTTSTPPPNPFGDTPIDDRSGSDEGSSPFGATPVDDR